MILHVIDFPFVLTMSTEKPLFTYVKAFGGLKGLHDLSQSLCSKSDVGEFVKDLKQILVKQIKVVKQDELPSGALRAPSQKKVGDLLEFLDSYHLAELYTRCTLKKRPLSVSDVDHELREGFLGKVLIKIKMNARPKGKGRKKKVAAPMPMDEEDEEDEELKIPGAPKKPNGGFFSRFFGKEDPPVSEEETPIRVFKDVNKKWFTPEKQVKEEEDEDEEEDEETAGDIAEVENLARDLGVKLYAYNPSKCRMATKAGRRCTNKPAGDGLCTVHAKMLDRLANEAE